MIMKFRMNKNLMVDALQKMCNVATRALMPKFDFGGWITVEAKGKQVIFTSSNGFLTARCKCSDDSAIKISEEGKATVDAMKFRDVVLRIITEDESSPLELSTKGDSLTIRDPTPKRKKIVHLPIEQRNHKEKIKRPTVADLHYFEADQFRRAVAKVSNFQSKGGYKPQYIVVCFHWVDDNVRFVCGDGCLFAIMSIPKHENDEATKGFLRVAPVSQLLIINTLIAESKNVEVMWKDKYNLYLKSNDGIELVLEGIPEVDYPEYSKNAFRFEEAKAYADVLATDLSEGAGLVGVLGDKEKADQGQAHCCQLIAPSGDGLMKFEVTDKLSKFRCEYEVPATYYSLDDDQASFKSIYAYFFFETCVQASKHPYLRFYLINEGDVVNVRSAILGEPDDRGIPELVEDDSGETLSFFFAALDDPDEMEENSE